MYERAPSAMTPARTPGTHRAPRPNRRRTRGTCLAVLLGLSAALAPPLLGTGPASAAPAEADATAAVTATAGVATAGPALPFTLPSTASLRASSKKVFAHWVPTIPISLDNEPPADDYYARNYLDPEGEGGKNASYGGFLRDRPLGRAPLPGNWRLADMEAEVRQATSVGIDGFTMPLYHLGDSPSQAWDNASTMMQAASAADPGFKIILMPDMTGTVGGASPSTLAKYVAQLGKAPSAYRLGDGRLVVSPFQSEKHSVDWWRSFLSTMKSTYGISVAFMPNFLDDQKYRAAFAPISWGMGNWGSRNPAWNSPTITYSTYPLGRVKAVHDLGKVWMQPVSAQDERPRQGLFDEAQNTTNLRDTWQIATASGSEMVQLASWNDYPEGSQMAPSARNGWAWLQMSAYYLTRYKTGKAPAITRDTVYVTHRTQPVAAKPRFPQKLLMKLRGGSPARDTVEALTFLKAAGTVTITTGSTKTSCSVPAGVGVCTVPLHTGQVSASVTRSGSTVAHVTSPYTVTSTPYVQDLHYVAAGSTPTASLVAAPSSTVTLTPTSDGYANQGAPDRVFGSSSSLTSRGSLGEASYMRFSVPATPAGKTLTAATLRLTTTSLGQAGSATAHTISLVTGSWSASTLTWANHPAVSGTLLGSTPTGTRPETAYTVPLSTSAVAAQAGRAATFGVTGSGTDDLWFWSSNHANAALRPTLTLTYR